MGILLTALLLTGCAEQQAAEPVAAADENAEPNSRTVFAMDTVMELSAYGADDALMEAAEQEILGLESRLSVTDAGSEIYALDHNGLAELSPDNGDLALGRCRGVGIHNVRNRLGHLEICDLQKTATGHLQNGFLRVFIHGGSPPFFRNKGSSPLPDAPRLTCSGQPGKKRVAGAGNARQKAGYIQAHALAVASFLHGPIA